MDKSPITYAYLILQVGEEYLVWLRVVIQFGNNIIEITLLVIFGERIILTQMIYLLIAPLHDKESILITEWYNRVSTKMLLLLM
jgi:hypothetical protein